MARGSDYTTCICARCLKLPLPLHKIKNDTAKKHLKRYGPGKLSGAQPRVTAVQMALNDGGCDDLGPQDDDDDNDGDDGAWQMEMPDELRRDTGLQVRPQQRLFHPADTFYTPVTIPGNVYPPLDDPDSLEAPLVPPAFADNESSAVRIAYLQAILNNVQAKMAVRFVNENLTWTFAALEANNRAHNQPPLFPPPVKTLASARQQLGIDADPWIIQYAVCPICWKHYTPHELQELQSPSCTTLTCSGEVFNVKHLANGTTKRTPVKIIPHVSLIQTLRCMVRRPGFRKLVTDSRDKPANANDNEDFVMTDMCDGSIWHELKTGI
ncbi:hypothetical protein VKT23_014069 [Stygiomarasmius scandens]|uniref:Uncharacterized protein n=1 Tax=Marasmiellus scandens TaxID=2682957 RepID=A0ABR1J4Q9_9AGAR